MPEEEKIFPFNVTPDDLLPSARKEYDALVEKYGQPVIISVTGKSKPDEDSEMTTYDVNRDTHTIEITDYKIRWTPEYVRKVYKISDESLSAYKPYPDEGVIKALKMIAKRLHIKPMPKIVEGDEAQSGQTREGTDYIRLDTKLPPVESIAQGIHELGHIKNGDSTAESLAEAHNADSLAVQRAQESLADQVAADMCWAIPLSNSLKRSIPEVQKLADTADVSWNEAMDRLDPTHPRLTDRTAYLDRRAELDKRSGRCPN